MQNSIICNKGSEKTSYRNLITRNFSTYPPFQNGLRAFSFPLIQRNLRSSLVEGEQFIEWKTFSIYLSFSDVGYVCQCLFFIQFSLFLPLLLLLVSLSTIYLFSPLHRSILPPLISNIALKLNREKSLKIYQIFPICTIRIHPYLERPKQLLFSPLGVRKETTSVVNNCL